MTFLTQKQQEILKKEIEEWRKATESGEFIEKMDYALTKLHGFDQPTCKTEEDMLECDNMNR